MSMNTLGSLEIETIALHLGADDVIRFCSTTHEVKSMQHRLLQSRNSEIVTCMNLKHWCTLCDSSIDSNSYYALFVCRCQGGENFPYYHMSCINAQSTGKSYSIKECPHCHIRRPLIVCDISS